MKIPNARVANLFFYQKQKFAELTRIAFFFFFSFLSESVIIFLKSTYFKSDGQVTFC